MNDLSRIVENSVKRVMNESVDMKREIQLAQKELVKMGTALSSVGMRLEGTRYHQQYKRIYDEIVKLNNALISQIRGGGNDMSYFPIDITTMNEERIMIQKTHEEPKKRSPHNVPHSQEAKKKISETQQARYEMIRQLVRKGQQKQMTEDKVRDICHEVLNEYLDRLTKPNNNRPMNINI